MPVVSTDGEEGHISVSFLRETELLFLHLNTEWQYLIYSHIQETSN